MGYFFAVSKFAGVYTLATILMSLILYETGCGSATIASPNTLDSYVTINGSSATLRLTVETHPSNGIGTHCIVYDDVTITTTPSPSCSITGSNGPLCPSTIANNYAAPVSSSYSWSISGNGTLSGSTTSQTVSVTAGQNCNASFTLTLNTTDANGCTAIVSGTITQPSALFASAINGSIFCNGGTTTVNISASGGTTPLLVLAALSLLFGVLFVLPVGGADVPIVISLLNAFTGLTVAASGYVLDSTLLIIAGTLVGASGTILTRMMAEAMGRSLFGTLFGAFTAKPQEASGAADDRPVRSGSPDDVAILLNYARRVVIVPGFGLAVAQAQHTVRELADLLISKGIDVAYGIHPVAGRMPGHMNVLLAEANVPYDQLAEMEEVNPTFAQTDVAIVIGANDVVNPAAKTSPGAPIYGMPILEVANAANIIFLKRSMRPGFAGIENELLYDPKTMLLFGDAKASLTKVVSALKNL